MSLRTLVLIVTLALFVTRTAPAGGAIAGAEKKDAYTQHDENPAKLDFNRRTLAKAYEQVGTRNPKWDDAALEFLDAIGLSYSYTGHNMIYMPGPVPSPAHLEKLGKAAVDAGCTDPLVLYCYGSILYDLNQAAQAKPILLKAADDLAGSKYPAIRIANGYRQAINLLDQEGDAEAIAKHRTAGRAAALRAATGKFESHDQQVVFPIIADHPGAGLNERRAFYKVRRANDVHVTVWENSITTTVNGKLAKQGYRIRSDTPAEGTYFGLGSHWAPEGAIVGFSDIQVRRLHEAPAHPGQ